VEGPDFGFALSQYYRSGGLSGIAGIVLGHGLFARLLQALIDPGYEGTIERCASGLLGESLGDEQAGSARAYAESLAAPFVLLQVGPGR
jgi:hypothetical protein